MSSKRITFEISLDLKSLASTHLETNTFYTVTLDIGITSVIIRLKTNRIILEKK